MPNMKVHVRATVFKQADTGDAVPKLAHDPGTTQNLTPRQRGQRTPGRNKTSGALLMLFSSESRYLFEVAVGNADRTEEQGIGVGGE
jgi:hypothetical protein